MTEPVTTRVIDDVETIRAMADPTRVAILRLLMSGGHDAPPVMSAKQIAAVLGEPQTKLYRHLKQLEAVGLIHVAEIRTVSGIPEHRYRTGQINLLIGPDLLHGPEADAEFANAMTAVLDEFRDDLLREIRGGRVDVEAGSGLDLVFTIGSVARVSPARAAEFRAKLVALQAEFDATEQDPDGVPMHLLLGWYAPRPRA